MNKPIEVDNVSSWQLMLSQAKVLVSSGMLPSSIKKPEQAVAIMLKGRELGLPAMLSFSHIHIIDGKPTISSEMMLSLIYQRFPTATINFLRMDSTACEIEASRPNGSITKFKFDIEDAKMAGLSNRPVWQKFTRAMLRSRCVSEMTRVLFPDVVLGCYTPDEILMIEDPKRTGYDANDIKHVESLRKKVKSLGVEDSCFEEISNLMQGEQSDYLEEVLNIVKKDQ